MQRYWQDFRYAARTLGRSPGFAIVAILTLALGIGASTVVFTLVDGLVLNPFSFPDDDSLVGIGPAFPKLNRDVSFIEVLSPPEYRDIETQSRTLQQVVSWDMGNRQVAGEGLPENLFTAFWWGNAFETLRVRPELGRGFTREETARGDPVAVISYRYWQRRFGADPGVIGQVLHINGNPYTLIGVMPSGTLIYGTDLWIPMWGGATPERFPRGRRQFQVLARLAPGITLSEVNAELSSIAGRIEQEHQNEFNEYAEWRLVADTWKNINTRTLRPAAFILAGAVAFVILLVCANLAGLFLARAMRRRQEIAIRTALGASRGRIVAQLLSESVLVSVLGGAIGFVLAAAAVAWLASMISIGPIPIPGRLEMNLRVFSYAAAVSVFAGLLFGILPALQMTRLDPQEALKEEGNTTTQGAARLRLQGVLVAAEVALSVVLLVGGGLLLHSLYRLHSVAPGFDTDNVLTLRLTLPWEKYQGSQITHFFNQLLERIETLPGVTRAGVASQFPPIVFGNSPFQVEGEPAVTEGQMPTAYTTLVSEGFFRTLGIPVRMGRVFEEWDRTGAPMVAVINESAARRYFAGVNPLGRRIRVGRGDSLPFEIIGVVGSTHNRGLDQLPQPEIFASIRQAEGWSNQLFVLIRSELDPGTLAATVRKEVSALDSQQPVYAIRTIDEAFADSTATRRIASLGLSLFALFALTLAAVGIFAVVSFKASARTREIGVRLALGASRVQVGRLVVRQALLPVVVGALVGFGAALLIGRAIQDFLFGVGGNDPLTLGSVLLILIGVSLAASYIPAHRACRTDPSTTLRHS